MNRRRCRALPGALHRRITAVGLAVVAVVSCAWMPCVQAEARHAAGAADVPRVAAIDWGQAQTLTALGVAPVAAGQIDSYNIWVGQPKLPASTQELGLRAQPNMELLSQLDLDLITLTSMYASAEPRLAEIAPVERIDIYQREGDVWANTLRATRELAKSVHRQDAGEQLIRDTEQQIAALAGHLGADTPPLLVVQFMDARHVRVYGDRSLIQATMERLGLSNAWQGDTLMWGFALVPLQRLAAIDDAVMVVMGPIPVGVEDSLARSVVWQSLPLVKHGPVIHIPGVWSYGGLPSATRFARLIVDALAALTPARAAPDTPTS